MKNNFSILCLILLWSCNSIEKSEPIKKIKNEGKNVNSEKLWVILNDTSEVTIDHLEIHDSNSIYKIDLISLNLSSHKEDFSIFNNKIKEEIQASKKDFLDEVKFYIEENEREILEKNAAELKCEVTLSIINDSIISAKISTFSTFPIGTIYPYNNTTPLVYSLKAKRFLRKEEIILMDENFKNKFKSVFINPDSINIEKELMDYDQIVNKGLYKVHPTKTGIEIFYNNSVFQEESSIELPYSDVLTNLSPFIRNNLKSL